MRFAFWITEATNTDSEYVILPAFPPQQWLRERVSLLRLYVHCMSCFHLYFPASILCQLLLAPVRAMRLSRPTFRNFIEYQELQSLSS